MVTQLDYAEVWRGVSRAGYWFFAVVALWAFLYIFNTATWWLIIKGVLAPHRNEQAPVGPMPKVPLLWLYKITVSGFALNYATPGGLMGGEPYRIMELTPRIGGERATASVILYVMTHIFSHFWFWLLSVVLFLVTKPVDAATGLLLLAVTAFCALGIWFFVVGYRRGLAVRAMNVLGHIPYLKRWTRRFVEQRREQLDEVDRKIAVLHRQNPLTFVGCVLLELACRVCSSLEIYFVLLVLMPAPDFADCVLILAFTSLFANLLFFFPLQLGGREGGFLMSAAGLGLTTSAGIFVALLVRLREIVWTAIGLLLIKLPLRSR
ncbi:MAG: flippase-like domain-containing protein [Prevotella sp.]|nr:flippase-like domain-containing protein [Prevotella sp.]